jgi:hypothetical protein
MINERQIADRLHWGVALTPIVTVLVFYSMILHARLALGEWPTRASLDPNGISSAYILFGFHCMLTFVSIVLASLSPLAWIVLLSQAHLIPSVRDYIARFSIFVACLSFTLWMGYTDPGNYLNWFAD